MTMRPAEHGTPRRAARRGRSACDGATLDRRRPSPAPGARPAGKGDSCDFRVLAAADRDRGGVGRRDRIGGRHGGA